jgi:hypothetical protein
MGLNPFGTVSDYPSMLNKIALYTFGVSIAATAVLRWQVPAIDTALATMSFHIPIGDISIPLGTVLPAFLVAFVSRIFKLHDKISDLLGIRRRFDVKDILMPLALASGAPLSTEQIKKIKAERNSLMGEVFYKYASSSPGKAVIEQHYITLALDQWSWYWILLEMNTIIIITAIILLSAGKSTFAAILLIITLVLIWVMQGVRVSCSEYALQEVDQILEDGTRKRHVTGAFHAL